MTKKQLLALGGILMGLSVMALISADAFIVASFLTGMVSVGIGLFSKK